jgi:hypothetical protein
MPWRSQLAHQENVQRRIQPPRHLISDWHTASRQSEYDDVRPSGESCELVGQHPACIRAVLESETHAPSAG